MNELKELKAAAYDAMVQVREWQNKLNDLNQKIADYKDAPLDQPMVAK